MQIVGCDGHTRPWPRYRCSKNWVPHVRPSFGLTWAHHKPDVPRGVGPPHAARSVSTPRIRTGPFRHLQLLSSSTLLQHCTDHGEGHPRLRFPGGSGARRFLRLADSCRSSESTPANSLTMPIGVTLCSILRCSLLDPERKQRIEKEVISLVATLAGEFQKLGISVEVAPGTAAHLRARIVGPGGEMALGE